jgi:glycosyltransferase involved in cell wall biosynthesis
MSHRTNNDATRVAMIGTRGVPASYGGFETAVEEIGARLVERGHKITVYCRGRSERVSPYRGMDAVDLPAVKRRSVETLSHTTLSILHAVLRARPDVAIVFNAANSPLLPFLRAAQIPIALHTDGLEWQRGKWGVFGRRYYLLAERLAVRWADQLISDAQGIADYYKGKYETESAVIAYGAPLTEADHAPIRTIGLEPGQYHLVVCRFEPENHADVIIHGYSQSNAELPLVVVGGVPYSSHYDKSLAHLAGMDNRVRLLGPVWDQRLLDSLYSNSAVYIHGHSVGGTNPSLLRAMGASAPVAAFDVNFNREVLRGEDRCYWLAAHDVRNIVEDVEAQSGRWQALGAAARVVAEDAYRWDDVADRYEELVMRLKGGNQPPLRSGDPSCPRAEAPPTGRE